MSVVTRKGDGGATDLLFGKRTRKTSVRIRALGALDVAMAALGVLRVEEVSSYERDLVEVFQADIQSIMGWVAVSSEDAERVGVGLGVLGLREERYKRVDALAGDLDREMVGWASTGEDRVLAQFNMARAQVRVAEVAVWEVAEESNSFGDLPARYLNRLSDLLWLLARKREGK